VRNTDSIPFGILTAATFFSSSTSESSSTSLIVPSVRGRAPRLVVCARIDRPVALGLTSRRARPIWQVEFVAQSRPPPRAPLVMPLDLDPIYCAEQIAVPPDLADVLKAYTKEVVRRQPADVYAFSADYFANLADVTAVPPEDTSAPTVHQLADAYSAVKGKGELSAADFESVCVGAGVPRATVQRAFRLGEFGSTAPVKPSEPLTLLLTMTDASFVGICASLFDVFGEDGKLTGVEFLALFAYLTAKDPSVTQESLDALETALGDKVNEKLSFGEANARVADVLAAIMDEGGM
jgi:hypothetical protein